MVTLLAAPPILLTSVHIKSRSLIPVGRVCTYNPVELQVAAPLKAGGSPPSGNSAPAMVSKEADCTAASKSPAVAMVPAPPGWPKKDQSPASGWALKSLV